MQIITNLRTKHKDALIDLAQNAILELSETIIDSELSVDEIVEIANEITAIGAHLNILKNEEQSQGARND